MINDFSGDYLNFDSTKDGDIIQIIGEGKREMNEALKKVIYNIRVNKNGTKEMTYSPNNSSGKILQAAFGEDDVDWIGKEFTVLHVEKKMLIKPIKPEGA